MNFEVDGELLLRMIDLEVEKSLADWAKELELESEND